MKKKPTILQALCLPQSKHKHKHKMKKHEKEAHHLASAVSAPVSLPCTACCRRKQWLLEANVFVTMLFYKVGIFFVLVLLFVVLILINFFVKALKNCKGWYLGEDENWFPAEVTVPSERHCICSLQFVRKQDFKQMPVKYQDQSFVEIIVSLIS